MTLEHELCFEQDLTQKTFVVDVVDVDGDVAQSQFDGNNLENGTVERVFVYGTLMDPELRRQGGFHVLKI